MAKSQYPIDGKKGRAWKITSPFGWRIHPIEKIKKHHNGDDIWGPAAKIYMEAWHDGTVIAAGTSRLKNPDGSIGGVGWYVDIKSKINGKWYTTRYGHLAENSLKVKKGQKIEAGTVLGIMGNTGASAGRHCHFEICQGTYLKWTLDGKGYMNPIEFVEAVMKWEKVKAEGLKSTPVGDSVAPAPTHDEAGAKVAENIKKPKLVVKDLKAKPMPKTKLTNPVPGFAAKKKGK